MLADLFGRAETRAIQATPWGTWGDSVTGTTWAGQQVSTESSLQLLAVYGCVRLITDQITTLPVDFHRHTPTGDKVEITRPKWVDEPEPGVGWAGWLSKVLSSLLLDGNAYLALVLGPGRQILELIPVNAKHVQIKREAGRREFYINGTKAALPMLHIPGLMLAGSEIGVSPVEMAKQTIGLGISMTENAARLFGQGMVAGGAIEFPDAKTPEKVREIAQQVRRKHSGNGNAHLPLIIEGGGHWVNTSVSPEQAQWLESRKFTAAEIASMMFMLDPSDLGIAEKGSSLTYANLEQRMTHQVRKSLLPWIVRLEAALSSILPQPQYIKLNVDALMRGDSAARWANYASAATINTAAAAVGMQPVMLTAEMRELEDMPPLADLPPMPVPVPTDTNPTVPPSAEPNVA